MFGAPIRIHSKSLSIWTKVQSCKQYPKYKSRNRFMPQFSQWKKVHRLHLLSSLCHHHQMLSTRTHENFRCQHWISLVKNQSSSLVAMICPQAQQNQLVILLHGTTLITTYRWFTKRPHRHRTMRVIMVQHSRCLRAMATLNRLVWLCNRTCSAMDTVIASTGKHLVSTASRTLHTTVRKCPH